MRGLKALVIGMGILIVIGLAVVVVTIAKRTSDRSGGGADTAPTGRVFATDVAIPAEFAPLFSELPDIWTWVGAAIIFAGSYEVFQREARKSPQP